MDSKLEQKMNCLERPIVCCAIKYCFFFKKSDGNWGEWSVTSSCSASCGMGSQTRTRECDNPEPSEGGRFCAGSSTDYVECNVFPCIVSQFVYL